MRPQQLIDGPSYADSCVYEALEPLSAFVESPTAPSQSLADLIFSAPLGTLPPPFSAGQSSSHWPQVEPMEVRLDPLGSRSGSGLAFERLNSQEQSHSPPEDSSELERRSSGVPEKARERNKRAQRTFRQRQKAKAHQQEEELAVATARLSDLQEQVATLQELLSADGPLDVQVTQGRESPVSDRLRHSISAIQLDRSLLAVKQHKLYCLIERHQKEQEQNPTGTLVASSSAQLPGTCLPEVSLACSGSIRARKQHLQSMRPCTEWQGCTPVLMEDLYSSILEGRLDLLVPLANGQAPERTTVLRHLVAMPAQQHLQLQAQYHACLSSAMPFCSDSNSAHGKHFSEVMGEAMVLLTVFMECLPDQFMACQSISLLDGTTKMPAAAFEDLKAAAGTILLSPNQLAGAQGLHKCYVDEVRAAHAEREKHLQVLLVLQASLTSPGVLVPELRAPHQAARMAHSMAQISASFALQQEAYLNLVRSFVLCILTPFQAGKLCAAAYPYLIEFPSVLCHMLDSSKRSLASNPFEVYTEH